MLLQCVSRGRRCTGDIESPLNQLHKTWNCDPQVHKNLTRYSITKPSATSDEKKKSERCPSMLELTDPDSRHADMKIGDVRGGIPIEVEVVRSKIMVVEVKKLIVDRKSSSPVSE